MSSFSSFVSAFMKNRAGKKSNAPKHRTMKLESLEERQLLAVTAGEFAAIKDSYGTEFGFADAAQSEVNIERNVTDLSHLSEYTAPETPTYCEVTTAEDYSDAYWVPMTNANGRGVYTVMNTGKKIYRDGDVFYDKDNNVTSYTPANIGVTIEQEFLYVNPDGLTSLREAVEWCQSDRAHTYIMKEVQTGTDGNGNEIYELVLDERRVYTTITFSSSLAEGAASGEILLGKQIVINTPLTIDGTVDGSTGLIFVVGGNSTVWYNTFVTSDNVKHSYRYASKGGEVENGCTGNDLLRTYSQYRTYTSGIGSFISEAVVRDYFTENGAEGSSYVETSILEERNGDDVIIRQAIDGHDLPNYDTMPVNVTINVSADCISIEDSSHNTVSIGTAVPSVEEMEGGPVAIDNGDGTVTSFSVTNNQIDAVSYRGNLIYETPADGDEAYYTVNTEGTELTLYSTQNGSSMVYNIRGRLVRAYNAVYNSEWEYDTDPASDTYGSIKYINTYNPDGTMVKFKTKIDVDSLSGVVCDAENVDVRSGEAGYYEKVNGVWRKVTSGVTLTNITDRYGFYTQRVIVTQGAIHKSYYYGTMGNLKSIVTYNGDSLVSVTIYNSVNTQEDSYTVLTKTNGTWSADYYVNGSASGYRVSTGTVLERTVSGTPVCEIPVFVYEDNGAATPKYIYAYYIFDSTTYNNTNQKFDALSAFVDVGSNVSYTVMADGTYAKLNLQQNGGITYTYGQGQITNYAVKLDLSVVVEGLYINNVGQYKNQGEGKNSRLNPPNTSYVATSALANYCNVHGFILSKDSDRSVRPGDLSTNQLNSALLAPMIYVYYSGDRAGENRTYLYALRDSTDSVGGINSPNLNEGCNIYYREYKIDDVRQNDDKKGLNYVVYDMYSMVGETYNTVDSYTFEQAILSSRYRAINDDGSYAVFDIVSNVIDVFFFNSDGTSAAVDRFWNDGDTTTVVLTDGREYDYERGGVMKERREYTNGVLSLRAVYDKTAGTLTVTRYNSDGASILLSGTYDYDSVLTVTRPNERYDYTVDIENSSAMLHRMRIDGTDGTYVIYDLDNQTAILYNAEGYVPYSYADGIYTIGEVFDPASSLPTRTRLFDRDGNVIARVTYTVSNGSYTGKEVFDYGTSEISTYTCDAQTGEWVLVSTAPDPNYEVKNRIFYIDGSNNQGAVHTSDGGEVIVDHLGFYNGSAVEVKGLYLNDGYGYAPNSSYKSGNGGAVFLDNSANTSWTNGITFAFNHAETTGCSAEKNGGFIANYGGVITMDGSVVGNCCVEAKTARTGYGGAIFSTSDKTSTFTDTVFRGNYTLGLGGYGGAVANQSGAMVFVSCSFDSNFAVNESGSENVDILDDGGSMVIGTQRKPKSISEITGGVGGAIANWGTIEIQSTTFTSNVSANGGAISNANTGTILLRSSSVGGSLAAEGNTAVYGGGVMNQGNLTVDGTTVFANNSARINGGSISVSNVKNSNGEVTGSGKLYFTLGCYCSIDSSFATDNSAESEIKCNGGGIYVARESEIHFAWDGDSLSSPEYGVGENANYCKTTPENSNIGFDIPIVFTANKVTDPGALNGYGVQCDLTVSLPLVELDSGSQTIPANSWEVCVYKRVDNSEVPVTEFFGEPVTEVQKDAGETAKFTLNLDELGDYVVKLNAYCDTAGNRVTVLEDYKLCDLSITEKKASLLPNAGDVTASIDQVFDEIVPLEGDINGDGVVDVRDFTLMANAWFSMEGDENWDPNCDLDGDGFVGPGDFALFNMNWNK